MSAPFIPQRTRAEIASPAPMGQRHDQAKNIAFSLIGNGLAPEAVFVQLRSTYPRDVADKELQDLIAWAVSKNPQPYGYAYKARSYTTRPLQVTVKPERVNAEQATANAVKWLRDFRCDECDLWHASPWRPLEDWKWDSMMLLAGLYGKDEHINVVIDYTVETKAGGSLKANPKGAGKTLLRDDWLRSIREHGAPQSKAGAWIRPNPVKEHGSGKGGAICDADVVSYRFTILESDLLTAELALSLFARLPLPIAAILSSGGKSPHAWVKLDCLNAEEYREKVERIYALLARFGLDPNNTNESRLSRLPGAQREIGKQGDGGQRLLYLNDEASEAPIFERSY